MLVHFNGSVGGHQDRATCYGVNVRCSWRNFEPDHDVRSLLVTLFCQLPVILQDTPS